MSVTLKDITTFVNKAQNNVSYTETYKNISKKAKNDIRYTESRHNYCVSSVRKLSF